MANPQQIERDLREYLEKADNLRNEDRFKYLKTIFEKHFGTEKLDHMIIRHDLFQIISTAKSVFSNMKPNPDLSGKPVDKCDIPNMAVIEAFISYLNKNNLLNKGVKFDFTDPANEYDTLED